MSSHTPAEIATALCRVALEKKAADPLLLDLEKLVDYTDVFVILTCRNRRHVAAIAEELRLFAKTQLGLQPVGIEGLPAARWVLVDFGSVVVHLFDQPLRAFYNLDGLWSDAPRLPAPAEVSADGSESGDGFGEATGEGGIADHAIGDDELASLG